MVTVKVSDVVRIKYGDISTIMQIQLIKDQKLYAGKSVTYDQKHGWVKTSELVTPSFERQEHVERHSTPEEFELLMSMYE